MLFGIFHQIHRSFGSYNFYTLIFRSMCTHLFMMKSLKNMFTVLIFRLFVYFFIEYVYCEICHTVHTFKKTDFCFYFLNVRNLAIK